MILLAHWTALESNCRIDRWYLVLDMMHSMQQKNVLCLPCYGACYEED